MARKLFKEQAGNQYLVVWTGEFYFNMNDTKKYIFFRFILFIIISVCSIMNLYAGDKSNNYDIDWSLESKGIYSSGMSESHAYNMTGAKASYRLDYLSISSHFYQYFNYQITDGNGEYDYRSFSEVGASLEIDIYKYFNLLTEYSRSENFINLAKNAYYANIEFDIASSILSAGYSYEVFKYDINSNDIESIDKNFSLGIDYIINDSIEFDLTYTYSSLYFNSLESEYSKNIFRTGCMYVPSGRLFLTAGASGGKDSEKYNIYGTDFGITLFIYSRFKLNFHYYFEYFDPTITNSYTSTSGSGSGNGNSSSSKNNPYLMPGKEGEAYYSHIFNFGVTASF